MTYLAPRGNRRRRGLHGLGDLTDPGETACLNRANASPQVVAIDAQIQSLQRSWNPAGYFRAADIADLMSTLATQFAEAGAALAAAPASTSDAERLKSEAFKDAGRRYQDRGKAYANAVAEAQRTGVTAIDAPGLKDWVVSSMLALSNVYVTATVLHCRFTWIEKWLDRAYKAMVTIGAAAARIVGIAIDVGQRVIKVADWIGELIKYAPYAAVGAGAFFVYRAFKSRGA